jgi:outer membrane protein assembly factor BamD
MFRRFVTVSALALALIFAAACRHTHVQNPIANLNSKQPDKVLFDRAMDAINHGKYDVARMSLQTLINTYPDSEYIARAKLAVADSWYAEGSTAALQQAEIEYKDFETFFPNMAEAAEAQMKVGDIHFRQMEKPDRDFTHAKRAEQEYQELIRQYPDSKLLPQAKAKLREVQEVLAEREFRIGRYYFLRESYPASIARLKTLSDTYPLYSGADEALFMLGQAYEKEADIVRANKDKRVPLSQKEKLIADFDQRAADAYSRIITRYPVMDRVRDAKARLEALHRPVPTPDPKMVAQNEAEQKSRGEIGMFAKALLNFHRRPDFSQTASIGDPTLELPQPMSATEVVQRATRALGGSTGGTQSLSVETVGTGAPDANQPVPRSDQTNFPADNNQVAPQNPPATSGDTAAQPNNGSAQPASGGTDTTQSSGVPELKPVTPEQTGDTQQPASPQNAIPDLANSPAASTPETNTATAPNTQSGDQNANAGANQQTSPASQDSTSKKKKKNSPR